MRHWLFQRGLILAAALASIIWSGLALATPVSFKVSLVGPQEIPPVESAGSGSAEITYDPTTRKVSWSVVYSGLSSPVTMAHFHGPASLGEKGPVIIWLSAQGVPPTSPITGDATLTPEQAAQFTAGQWYINVHTRSNPAGEIRGQIVPPNG